MSVRLEAPDAAALEQMLAALPAGFRRGGGPPARTLEIFEDGRRRVGLRRDGVVRAAGFSFDVALALVAGELETLAATRSATHAFLHAGGVELAGRAILLPGRSHAGKSTLVRAFLDRGARYLSDDSLPIDRRLRAHPFSRPLRLRPAAGTAPRPVALADIGAKRARSAIPISAIVCTEFDPAVRGLRAVARVGRAAFAELLAHAPGVRLRPDVVLPILVRLAQRVTVLAGPRGEAAAAVSTLLALLGGEMPGPGSKDPF